MSEQNVELRINVINQLILLKNSTFKDRYSFIDENMQNSQRAKATEFRVSSERVDNDVYDIHFVNNGAVLDDFQKLFSMAETGWDEETVANENPFGLGFFSNITAASIIDIYSGNKFCRFDVDEVLRTRNVSLDVQDTEEVIEGFKVTLRAVKFNWRDFPYNKMGERVKLLGRYTHDLQVYWNNVLCEPGDICEVPPEIDYNMILDTELCKGWLGLTKVSWNSKLRILYHGRVVREITEIQYAVGDIHITDKALNLTAPDRKDVIADDKWLTFLETIREYIKELATQVVLDPQACKEYEWAVIANCNVLDLRSKIQFDIIHASKINDYTKIRALRNQDLILKDEDKLNVDIIDFGNMDGTVESSKIVSEITETYNQTKFTESSGVVGGGSAIKHRRELGNLSDEMIIKAVWVDESELYDMEARLQKCAFYDIYVIVARTEIEKRILQDSNILNIEELDNKITVLAEIDTEYNNRRDDRGLMLLDLVSKLAGYDYNKFVVGRLSAHRILDLNGTMHNEVVSPEDPIRAIYSPQLDKVLVDRNTLKEVRFSNGTNDRITIQDYKYLCINLPTLCKELSLCGTNVLLEKMLIGLGTRVKNLEELEDEVSGE